MCPAPSPALQDVLANLAQATAARLARAAIGVTFGHVHHDSPGQVLGQPACAGLLALFALLARLLQ